MPSMMTWKAACALLELEDDHDLHEVQPAFRRAARRWHPDSSCDSATTAQFIQAQQAYERLTAHRDEPDPEDADEAPLEPGLKKRRKSYRSTRRRRRYGSDVDTNVVISFRVVMTTYERGTVTRSIRDCEVSFDIGPLIDVLRAVANQLNEDPDDE